MDILKKAVKEEKSQREKLEVSIFTSLSDVLWYSALPTPFAAKS